MRRSSRVVFFCVLLGALPLHLSHGDTKPPLQPVAPADEDDPPYSNWVGSGAQTIVCYNAGPCGGVSCVKVPTSLPSLNTAVAATDWESAGGNCGTKRCFLIFRCACGPPLAAAACL